MTTTNIEKLTGDNYDTWKIHAEATLYNAGCWEYVSGEIPQPPETATDVEINQWKKDDKKAKSTLVLTISSSELKQIKNCETSKDVWDTLKKVYQSEGPARKATLLKRLVVQKMQEGDSVREHLNTFTDAVDKLKDMDVNIHDDLLSIMMLYSLSQSYENFRVAIESRDTLPKPSDLKVKILEEADARNSDDSRIANEDAFYSSRKGIRHASHPNVLQEVLYCFQGVDGTIVKFDKQTGFTIRNEVCFEQSHMVYQFLELGFLFHSVKKLLESQRDCMVSKGLAAAIQTKLNDYHMHIANVQATERPERGVDVVTLTAILPWAREKMLILQFMITILEETKDMVGGAVLNPILRHLPHGNPLLRANFEELVKSASMPLFQMIWKWIVMGAIKDPYDEFFITENIEYARTKAWQCQFTLRNEYVPKSLDGMCAQLILDVGKSMHFINKYFPEKALEFSTDKKDLFDIGTSDLSSFATDDGKPVLVLRQMYFESSELVLNIMKNKYKLRDFFTQLHEYIFLTQGHFATYLMDLMHPDLYKTVREVDPSHLEKLLHKAIRACSTSPLEPSIYENIEVHYNDFPEDEVIADVFTLQFKMVGPIKIMFQIFDLSYRKLFMFMWKKNHVLYTMSHSWKLMRTLFKTKNLPSEIQRGLQNLFTMNFQLIRFMYQLDFYILYEVIGKHAAEFFEKFDSIKTIDEVVDAHAKMLRFILLGTLLEEHAEISVQLTNIFSLVPDIEELTMRLFVYLENLGDGFVAEDDVERVLNARVQILLRNNEVAIKNFISFLKSCKHADGLNAVCDRLNYNEFYLPDGSSLQNVKLS